jgi:hypothetical protein
MKIAHPSTAIRAAAAVLAAAFVAALAAGQVAAKPTPACALLRLTEVRATLGSGSPAFLSRGGSAGECIIRGGGRLPLVLLANSAGRQGYNDLKGAPGAPLKALRGVGTEAVTYDRLGVSRGVIVRKGSLVLQISTTGIGSGANLATVAQIVKLARFAVPRL